MANGSIAVCNFAPLGVLLGNGDGTFQTALTYSAGGDAALSVRVADVNADGKLDLLVANQCSDPNCLAGSVGVLLGNGDGTFQTVVTYDSGGEAALWVAVADVNSDGKPDLLLSGGSASATLLLGNGDGTFQTAVSIGSARLGNAAAVADVNGDGAADLLLINSGNNSVGVMLGVGDGTFQTAVTFGSGGYQPDSSVAADVNGDNKLDLLVANGCGSSNACNNGTVAVLINTSLPFTTTALTSSPNPSDSAQAVVFTATVTPGQNGTPTGSVSFFDGGINIGNSNLNSSGVATLTMSTLSPGSHAITADYSGDTNFASSISHVLHQVVLGAIVVLSPPSLNFGNQTVNIASAPQTSTLMNTGNVSLIVNSINVVGANHLDFPAANNCGASVPAGGSCQISVTFDPSTTGSEGASVSLTDSAPDNPQSIPLTGVGTPAVYLSPSSVIFPAQYVGTSGLPQTVMLNNTSNTPIVITSVTATPGDFAPLSTCGNTLAVGGSCAIGVFFDPTLSGTRTGTLTVSDTASSSPQTALLTGTGQDFSMVPSGPSTETISPGQTASYTLAIAPTGGFKQTVSFTCSGAPAGSVCSVPSSVALNGSSPTTITVTVTSGATSGRMMQPGALSPRGSMLATCLGLSGLPGLIVLGVAGPGFRHRSRLLGGLAFLCLLSVGTTWIACGGGSSAGGGTSYNLVVTGTFTSGATTLTHNTNLTLMVQ